MSMLGELFFFLSLHITQSTKCIFIPWIKYLKEMLNKFGRKECSPTSTPMVTRCKLNKDDESPKVNQTMYRWIIGNLLYLIVGHYSSGWCRCKVSISPQPKSSLSCQENF